MAESLAEALQIPNESEKNADTNNGAVEGNVENPISLENPQDANERNGAIDAVPDINNIKTT